MAAVCTDAEDWEFACRSDANAVYSGQISHPVEGNVWPPLLYMGLCLWQQFLDNMHDSISRLSPAVWWTSISPLPFLLSVCYSQYVLGWHCFSTKSTMLTYLVWMRFIWWCPCAVTTRSNSCRARRMSSPPPRAIVRWSLVPGLFQANQGAIWFTPRLGQLCPEQHSGRASQSVCVSVCGEPQPLSTSYDWL